MKRSQAIDYVSYVVDDSLNLHDAQVTDDCWLFGWQCGFEPLFVAVKSYLPDVKLEEVEAMEIAIDLLEEKKWFSGDDVCPDYIISPVKPV